MRELPCETDSIVTQFADDVTNTETDSDIQKVVEKLELGFAKTKDFCNKRQLRSTLIRRSLSSSRIQEDRLIRM